MFEFIRTHQKLMQFFLVLILAPLFIIGGLSAGHFGESDDGIAKVGNKVISQQQLDIAVRQQGAQAFSVPNIKQLVLDSIITQDAIAIEAKRDLIRAGTREIQDAVLENYPSLLNASLTQEARAEEYTKLASERGLTVAGLEDEISRTLVSQRLAGGVMLTAFEPKSVTSRIADIVEQEREVQQVPFKTADFTAQVKVTDDMLKAYYNKNLAQFQVPEQAKFDYVVLSVNNLAQQMTVSDKEARDFYDAKDNQKRFTVEEQRRASHILIKVDAGANDAAKAAAKAKAEKLVGEARKNPGDFAKLAKENSDDSGSAEKGGDLDFFGKGMMVPEFQDAAAKLKVGEISDPVQTKFGYHIIMLTGIKPGGVKSFDDAKAEIVAELKKQKATKKFAEVRESFKDVVFQKSDSLKPAVDKMAAAGVTLKIETASGITRKPDPAAAPTVAYNNSKFLTALFDDDSIKNKHNTDTIQVADGVVVAGHVTEYKATAQKPFAEVQALVKEAVTQAEAKTLAQKAGAAKLAALKAKDDMTGFDAPQTVSEGKPAGLSPAVLQSVLTTYADKLPAFVEVEMPGQGYSVFRINKISQPANQDAARRTGMQKEIENTLAKQDMLAYVEALKQKAKVKILRPDALTAPVKDGGDSDN